MTDIVELGFKADTTGILKTDSALNKLGATSDKTANQLDANAKAVNSSFITLNKTMLTLGATFAALGTANALGNLVSVNREFGQSVADLSAITGAAGDDLKFYVEQAKEIGRTTSLSASQASEAFKLIASAKPDLLDSADALAAVTEEAVTLAEAAGITLPESASALGSALNQFQLDAGQANEAINILAASSQLGAAEIPLVTEALKNAGSAANALDVDLAETVAGIQALAKAGIQGAEAGTALRQVLLRLERTADAELQPSIVGLDAAIAELSSRQLSTVELMKLFGDEAFSSATAILAQQETLKELNVTLRDTDTATEQAAIRMNTLNGDILALNSAFEGLQIEAFTDDAEGFSRRFVQALTSSINSITESMGAVSFVVNEMQRNMELAFAGIGFAVDILGERIGFAISSPLDFIKLQLVDFLQFIAEFADKIDSILPNNMQLGFGDSLRGFTDSLATPGIENYQERVSDLKSDFDSLVTAINRARDTAADNIISEEITKIGDAAKAQEDAITDASESTTKSIAETVNVSDDFKKTQNEIANGAERIGAAFQTSGNGIIDTFGEATQVLMDFGNEMSRLTDLQIKLDEEKAKGVDVTKEQAQLNEMMVSTQLSGIGSLLGASANLFDEQSKEREALHRAEVAFAAIEIALAAKKAFANAKTAITSAFAAPFPLNFAAGATMIGIMSGLLGDSFGGSGGVPISSGTGTTLGDDEAQSGSVNNSIELYEDIQLDILAELKGIRDSIGDLAGAINQLTIDVLGAGGLDTGFVTGLGVSGGFDSKGFSAGILGAAFGAAGLAVDALTGGFVSDLLDGIIGGLLGSSESFIEDSGIQVLSQTIDSIVNSGDVLAQTFAVVRTESESLFGLISSTSVDTQFGDIDSEFTRGLANIFAFMTDSLLEVGDALGLGFTRLADNTIVSLEDSLSEFTIPELNISFEGKTGEEIEQELNAVIGAVGDDLAGFLFPALTQYQKINEGMYETVLRVTKETIIFEDSLDKLNVSFGVGTSGIIPFGQAVIDASGGLENFTDSFNAFYDEFFTEQEKAENTLQSLTEIFATLGLELPETMEEYRDLVEETAAMGVAGAETLAVLLEVSGAFADVTEKALEFTVAADNLRIQFNDLFSFFGRLNNEIFTNFDFDATQAGTELFNSALDRLIEDFGSSGAVTSAIANFSNFFLDTANNLVVTQSDAFSALTQLRNEFAMSGDDLPPSFDAVTDLTNQLYNFTGTAEELSNEFANLVTGLNSADVESGLLTGLLDVMPALQDYITLLQQQEQALESSSNALKSQQQDLFIDLLETQGNTAESLALQRAREIESLQELDDANRAAGLESNLADLKALIFLQEDYNTALENSKTAISNTYDALNTAITAQADVLNDTLRELLSARASLGGAIRAQEAQRAGSFELASRELINVLNQARGGDFSGVSGLDLSTLTAGDTSGFSSRAEFNLSQARITTQLKDLDAILAIEEENKRTELDSLDEQLITAKNQHDTLLGIEESQLNLNDLQAEINARNAEFQLASTNIATLQLAATNEQLTEQQQEELNQALIDAQDLSFQALIDLTEDQRDDIVAHLTSLISSADSNTEMFIAAIDLLRLDIADLASISMTGNENDSVFYDELKDLVASNDDIIDIDMSGVIVELVKINDSISSQDLSMKIDFTDITDDLTNIYNKLKELTSNQWHQNRNTLPHIQSAVEYLRDSLINDDRRKVSLPNSHYSGLFGIQTATEALASGLINDNRQKVSLPNSHYKNQEMMIEEMKLMKTEIMEMRERQNTIGVENIRQNKKSADALQEFQINGIDVNETNAA